MLNLLRVILFECNFYSPNLSKKSDPASVAIRQNAENLFKKGVFMRCIVDGMKNEVNFVRYHYI